MSPQMAHSGHRRSGRQQARLVSVCGPAPSHRAQALTRRAIEPVESRRKLIEPPRGVEFGAQRANLITQTRDFTFERGTLATFVLKLLTDACREICIDAMRWRC